MRWEKGKWLVQRNCCISGFCIYCHEANRLGKPAMTVIQGKNYSKRYAEFVAANWSSYKAVAKRMTAALLLIAIALPAQAEDRASKGTPANHASNHHGRSAPDYSNDLGCTACGDLNGNGITTRHEMFSYYEGRIKSLDNEDQLGGDFDNSLQDGRISEHQWDKLNRDLDKARSVNEGNDIGGIP